MVAAAAAAAASAAAAAAAALHLIVQILRFHHKSLDFLPPLQHFFDVLNHDALDL